MARTRIDQNEIQLDRETVAGDGGTFAGSQVSSKVENLATPGDSLELIDNASESETGGDQGATAGISLAVDSALTFDRYVQGLGTAAGDGVAPTANFGSELMASWAQQLAAEMVAPTPPGTPTYYTTGSTVLNAGGSTVSKVFLTDADFGELPNAGDVGVMGFTVAGAVEWRPYIWDTGGNSCDLLLDLSGIPAGDSVVYGVINFPRAESWTQNLPFPLACKKVGNTTARNVLWSGAVFDLSIPEAAPRDVPKFSVTSRAFEHERGAAGTKDSPSTTFGSAMKNGRLIIARYIADNEGSANPVTSVCSFRVGVEFGGMPDQDWCINDVGDTGMSGFSRVQSPPRITCTFPIDSAMPAGLTDTNWHDAVENQESSGNDVKVFVVYGNTPGKTVTAYLPQAFARLWEKVNENGLGYEKVTFAARDADLLAHMSQG